MSTTRGARQPTIKEVATLAGVSPMTVSRTLAGGVNVRPDLQARVMAAVRELGYYRNENARSLRPGQPSGLIGVAITNLANPYYGNFALGVEEVAAEHGRRIILGNTGEDAGRERQLVSDFIGRQVDGLILVPTSGEAAHLQPERLGDVPLVLASRRVPGLDVDTVLLDDVGGAYRGTIGLLDAGHTRIGFLGNRSSVFTGERRYRGYEQAMTERGAPVDPSIIARDQQDVDAASRAARAMLDHPEPPTAIFSANNRNTIGALREIGRRIRDGLPGPRPAVVSFDDFELSELMPVPVTIIDHDARLLGREAATLLFARLEGTAESKPNTVELPVTIEHP
ncbi:LacI family DNA-binding transcriptional regulator [Glycomyces algeriensis]|uniref:LacI family transcriptional regulator n=1 Tax=Glycomyces algeriensis TaxID=256037 RepID=A0A9W6GAG9_9ACTN|nr:LacI family DNA-binding transcriptional regulator [Glycomyces algeriensis]MDA1364468.1 LacI family DNA-binding transcriptional regulator [Glycomyces algeriensis]MDR7350501.1 LacI family transcriptional regulator [Glycomyces algeriensis]GLI43209.1 LacI family transcriptional regulator [Glycomyces algeriensis]